MNKNLILILILTLSSSAFAQQIKVRKVKGRQAVVEFSGGSLSPGQTYQLSSDEFPDSASPSSRKYSVALNFSLSNSKSDASNSQNETDITLSTRFGWNFASFELGPMVSLASDTSGSTTTTLIQLGGWADYNMIPNTPGEIFTYGLSGSLGAGQSDSGTGTSVNLMQLFAGGFVKWFPTGSNVGFRFDGGYFYKKISGGISTEYATSGLSLEAGLIGYF